MKDKQMEELIDACYDVMFQREAEMRELGLLNYGDSSYYIQNPDEYEKDKKIVELENEVESLREQLAEKDQAIEGLQEINQSLGQTCNNDAKEIERLNNLLKEEKKRNKKLNHEAQKYYEDAYCNGFQNQTAIAELEKVKEYIREFVGINDVKFICTTTITDQIDQQIKSLKGDANE